MNKICVVAKNKETYFIKRLIEEVGQNLSLFNPWEDLEFPDADLYLSRCTGVYGSDLDLVFLKTVSSKLINNFHVLNLFRSKKTQYEWFEHENIPSLPWISIQGQNLTTIEKFFRLYPESVVKPLVGQGGWGVEKLVWGEFKSWKKKKNSDDRYLLQPLIKDGREYRTFFIQGGKSWTLERKNRSGVAANFKNQGEAILTQLPPEASSEIQRLIEMSKAHYGAIDLIIKDGIISILELNIAPGVEQLEKVTGENVVRELVESFSHL
jgi:glutathione synthase/RimK-type ligase-like ATP-grasp enzyme